MSVRSVFEHGLHGVRFPASWLGIAAIDRDASGRIQTGTYHPIRLLDAMAVPGVHAAIDGPMFSNCDPGASYATSQCADPRFAQADLDDRDGRVLRDAADAGEAGKGVSVSVVRGQARWNAGSTSDPNATVSVQLYPSLVLDGVVTNVSDSGSNAQRVWRSAIAGYPDGSLAFWVGQASLQDFANRVRATGATWAGYTDGGGSAALGMKSSTGIQRWGSSEDRPVAVFVVAREPNARSAAAKVAEAMAIGAGVAVAAGLISLAWDRWSDDVMGWWRDA